MYAGSPSFIASFCLTHRKRLFSFLHAAHVFSLVLIFVHLFLCLCCPLFTFGSTSPPDNHPCPYQPIPNSSVCSCLDSLPTAFLSQSNFANTGLCSRRHSKSFFSLLLLLAGDVSLNPGPSSSSFLKASHLNIRSASTITDTLNKPELVQRYIIDDQVDVLVLTETWFSPDTPPSQLNLLTPSGYSIQHIARPSGRGGGIAVIFRSTLLVSVINKPVFPSFEHLLFRISCSSKSYLFLALYRPPSTSKSDFLSDFAVLLEDIASSPSDLIIMGDFNFHLDSPDDHYSSAFSSLLDNFDLKQHILSPTHSSGHILDLIITQNSTPISDIGTIDHSLSDHCTISCRYRVIQSPPKKVSPRRLCHDIDSPPGDPISWWSLRGASDSCAPAHEKVSPRRLYFGNS